MIQGSFSFSLEDPIWRVSNTNKKKNISTKRAGMIPIGLPSVSLKTLPWNETMSTMLF